jgi:class 3 adenylate cyclase
MQARTAARVAWWLCAVALAMMAARLVVVVLGARSPLPAGFPPPVIQAIEVIGFVGAPILGGVIAAHRPENPYGWLWCVIGLCLGVTFLAVGYGAYTLVVEPGALPGGLVAAWASSVATVIDLALLPFVFLLFPTGRLPSGRWRPVAWTAGLVGATFVVVDAVQPGPSYDFPFVHSPVSLTGAPGELVEWLFASEAANVVVLAYVLTLTLSVASLAVRFRRARGQERQQLKWLAAVSVAFLGFFLADVFVLPTNSRLLEAIAVALLFSAMYAAIGIAVLRHRLYDIDVLLTRTLAYGLLTAAFTVVYLIIVVGIGALLGAQGRPNPLLSVVATGVIAVAFQPARDRSRRLANRLVYGRRATPYEVLSAFSRGVAASTDDSLQRMARLVVEATGARQATVWLRFGDVLQPQAGWPARGQPPEPVALEGRGVQQALAAAQPTSRPFPVGHEDELLGALTVTVSPAEPLTPAGEKLIADLATQTGLGLRFQRMKERALFARALASFLPPEVAELVEAAPSALALREELEATILFSDIRGFSTLAERLPPRQVAEVVGRHLTAMVEVVTSHGGVLDKFAGDAVMAVFGAPRPTGDHARRALACAAAMQRRQLALNRAAEHADLPTSQIGIGINTGTVIAGTLGGPGRLDYTVLGDAVNIAQRLQSEAAGGEILAAAVTVRQAGLDGAEPVGRRRLKGRKELVEVYRVHWAAAPSAAE